MRTLAIILCFLSLSIGIYVLFEAGSLLREDTAIEKHDVVVTYVVLSATLIISPGISLLALRHRNHE